MTKDDVFELFHGIVPVELKRMFGGLGIRSEGTFFGLVLDGELFLKVDDETRPFFEAHGSTPFLYEKKTGQQVVMSYYRLPLDAYDERDLFQECVRNSLSTARRALAIQRPKLAKTSKQTLKAKARIKV